MAPSGLFFGHFGPKIGKAQTGGPGARGQPLTYDFSLITQKGGHDLLGLRLPVPSTASWRAESDGKRFSGMNEIDGG
jgi:hypothetical protein